MSINSATMPERMRRLLAPEQRKEMKLLTSTEAQSKLDGKREKELQENIAALLRQRGIWFARQRMDRKTTGVVGQPDFLLAIKGRAIAWEIKLVGKYLTKEQNACMRDMESNGWICIIVRSERQAVDALNYLEMTCR